MDEIPQEKKFAANCDDNHIKNVRGISSEFETSLTYQAGICEDNLKDSSDEDAPRKRTHKRVKRFSDSDSDNSIDEAQHGELSASKNTFQAGISELQNAINTDIANSLHRKSRIQKNRNISDSEDSDSEGTVQKLCISIKSKKHALQEVIDSKEPTPRNSDDEAKGSESDNAVKNEEQQLRMKNKRNKLKDKFKTLLKTREKEPSQTNDDVREKSEINSSSDSSDEIASIDTIKQKVKDRITFKSSVCDPDTSDEESNQRKSKNKRKKKSKMKLTSPKPQRMSAKQAMENMQKIKSESNRMLREKEVSLPYHRPKALSLKDIMGRRKLAVSSDGKALPIKMNGEQLKQYAQMLEERQKEMMVLCKSESEEEETDEIPAELVNDTSQNSAEAVRSIAENFKEDKKDPIKDPAAVETNTTENETNKANSFEVVSTENTNEIETHVDSPKYLNNSSKQTELNSTENLENDVSTIQISEQVHEEQDSETNMKLVYNDSADSNIDENLTNVLCRKCNYVEQEHCLVLATDNIDDTHKSENIVDIAKDNTERDSQLISLHLDSENTDCFNIKDITDSCAKENTNNSTVNNNTKSVDQEVPNNSVQSTETNGNNLKDDSIEVSGENDLMEVENEFSDDDMNMEDIDSIIENAEIIKDIEDKVNSQFLVRDKPLNLNPKLTGAPGMVIDLDENDTAPKKSGIELLKERFTYFSKLKTPEEMEREKEKKLKPGTQLKKLKEELEEMIAEQRSLEWAKRLEDEKQQQKELKELRGDESDEDDIDKIEAAIKEKGETKEGSEDSDSGEEEPIENDVEIKDKPRVKNAMVDDEAEESDDEIEDKGEDKIEQNEENDEDDNGIEGDDDGIEADDDDESDNDESDESSESEVEQAGTKKGRILKAFEDSDEEDVSELKEHPVVEIKGVKGTSESKSGSSVGNFLTSQATSQDDELQLAQRPKSTSDDLFTSQESVSLASETKEQAKENDDALTQTFSILDSSKPLTAELDLNSSGKTIAVDATQSLDINNMDDANLCPITDLQNLPLPSQIPTTQISQSQPIGEDILALCTGQFYNNQFLSQVDNNQPIGDTENYDAFDNYQSQDSEEENPDTQTNMNRNLEKEIEKDSDPIDPKETENFIELHSREDNKVDKSKENSTNSIDQNESENFIELNNKKDQKNKAVDENLKSILDELADPEFDSPKPNKFFIGNNLQRDSRVHTEIQIKRKLVIDSDDEANEDDTGKSKKRKKLKKKKLKDRALQISDDEEDQSELEEEIEEYESELEEDNVDRLVEYDSEENEIEVKPQNPKKKRKMTEFFENEAELTSEDEWAGSGDEDEAGLDRMEREEGDDDTFHQGALQRELGQIHMRDVLDQDKREVRLIQELLFEDGDLGAGGRQRKFRWNNMGDEETGTVPDEFADTQEEEFESEEQWRKQRHERELFLRQLQNKDEPDESLNVSVNRTTIIKANLLSKTMSSLLMEVNNSTTEKTESPAVEKKTAKDIPSPKKPFALLQQSYQGSLLSRGRGALARLAALATPLAADDDTKVGTIGSGSRGNFVFAALTPDEKRPKVMKRRAEGNPSTPKLVKKIRTEEKNTSKSSLLDHFKL